MHWQYLLWDLDGTLTDPMVGITRSVQYALRSAGIEVEDPNTLCPFIGPPLRESFMEHYGMSPVEAEQAVAKYREYYAPTGVLENSIYPGIVELLADTRSAGAVHVLATSKPTIFAEQIARHFDIARYFTLISGSSLDNSHTTKTDVIRYALEQLHIPPAQAVMIGDRRYDIEGAAQTGLRSIGVRWGYGSLDELETARPDHLVRTVDELRELLR